MCMYEDYEEDKLALRTEKFLRRRSVDPSLFIFFVVLFTSYEESRKFTYSTGINTPYN